MHSNKNEIMLFLFIFSSVNNKKSHSVLWTSTSHVHLNDNSINSIIRKQKRAPVTNTVTIFDTISKHSPTEMAGSDESKTQHGTFFMLKLV